MIFLFWTCVLLCSGTVGNEHRSTSKIAYLYVVATCNYTYTLQHFWTHMYSEHGMIHQINGE
jgi:hypothetical protein